MFPLQYGLKDMRRNGTNRLGKFVVFDPNRLPAALRRRVLDVSERAAWDALANRGDPAINYAMSASEVTEVMPRFPSLSVLQVLIDGSGDWRALQAGVVLVIDLHALIAPGGNLYTLAQAHSGQTIVFPLL